MGSRSCFPIKKILDCSACSPGFCDKLLGSALWVSSSISSVVQVLYLGKICSWKIDIVCQIEPKFKVNSVIVPLYWVREIGMAPDGIRETNLTLQSIAPKYSRQGSGLWDARLLGGPWQGLSTNYQAKTARSSWTIIKLALAAGYQLGSPFPTVVLDRLVMNLDEEQTKVVDRMKNRRR